MSRFTRRIFDDAEPMSALINSATGAVVCLRCRTQPSVPDAAELRAELDAVPLRLHVEMLREDTL